MYAPEKMPQQKGIWCLTLSSGVHERFASFVAIAAQHDMWRMREESSRQHWKNNQNFSTTITFHRALRTPIIGSRTVDLNFNGHEPVSKIDVVSTTILVSGPLGVEKPSDILKAPRGWILKIKNGFWTLNLAVPSWYRRLVRFTFVSRCRKRKAMTFDSSGFRVGIWVWYWCTSCSFLKQKDEQNQDTP